MSRYSTALDFVKARRQAGLSDETMTILLHLNEVGMEMAEEIAVACEINSTTLPRYLSALVNSGHLERTRKPQDQRVMVFSLSDHGRRLINRLLNHFAPDVPG